MLFVIELFNNYFICYIPTAIFYCSVIEQVRNSNVDYRTLINLHQILTTFLPETPMTLKLIDIDIEPLDVYCCVKRKEDVLNRGLRQLQELSTHLCRLASCQCT